MKIITLLFFICFLCVSCGWDVKPSSATNYIVTVYDEDGKILHQYKTNYNYYLGEGGYVVFFDRGTKVKILTVSGNAEIIIDNSDKEWRTCYIQKLK